MSVGHHWSEHLSALLFDKKLSFLKNKRKPARKKKSKVCNRKREVLLIRIKWTWFRKTDMKTWTSLPLYITLHLLWKSHAEHGPFCLKKKWSWLPFKHHEVFVQSEHLLRRLPSCPSSPGTPRIASSLTRFLAIAGAGEGPMERNQIVRIVSVCGRRNSSGMCM